MAIKKNSTQKGRFIINQYLNGIMSVNEAYFLGVPKAMIWQSLKSAKYGGRVMRSVEALNCVRRNSV